MHPAALDDTHDPARRSWVAGADEPGGDFPLQNLPLGMGREAGGAGPLRPVAAIGDQAVDLLAAVQAGVLRGEAAAALQGTEGGSLNPLMARGPAARRALRRALVEALAEGSPHQAALAPCLRPREGLALGLPCQVGDYTDFYTGIHHATTVGRLFRPDQPLLPNYKWVPIGYHGRSSTLIVSGEPVRRPWGQRKGPEEDAPSFAPTQRLDHELELGLLIGGGNAQGEPIPIDEAEAHFFGVVLLNDWSARDVQAWEYQPLGPFLAKNFATTISPWIVTAEALAPFRAPCTRPAGDPPPLPHLDSATNRAHGSLQLQLEAALQTAAMRAAGQAHERLSRASYVEAAYWSPAQLIAHHSSNGCRLVSGDLLGTGTLSGPAPGQGGSMLELSLGGRQPLTLADGERRSFLEDGDSLRLRAWAQAPGARRLGWGDCEGTVLPARAG